MRNSAELRNRDSEEKEMSKIIWLEGHPSTGDRAKFCRLAQESSGDGVLLKIEN